LALSCKEQGKQATAQYYSRPNVSAQEIRNPETVIIEKFGFDGDIVSPKVYSPQQFMYKHAFLQKEGTLQVLKDLVTAEKIARRQYDELIMFPDLKAHVLDLLYIRNDEHEHQGILECIIQKLSSPAAAQKSTIKPAEPTQKSIGELYVTMLDRFADIERNSIQSYEEFLTEIQKSKGAIDDISDDATYHKVAAPMNELERKVNKHLNEERTHLDVINAMREMFSNMQLGNVY